MTKLSTNHSVVLKADKAGDDNEAEKEAETKQETDVQKTSSEEDADLPQTNSDLTQIDESAVENKESQTSEGVKEEEEGQRLDQRTENPAESKEAETTEVKTSDSLPTDEPVADMQDTDTEMMTAQTTEQERGEAQTEAASPQTQSLPEESPTAQPESTAPEYPTVSREEMEADPELPQRQVTRRRLEASSSSSEPVSKRLRSSTQVDQASSPPQPSKESVLPTDKATNEAPCNTGKTPEAAEGAQDQSEDAPISETPASDESHSALKKDGKKKQKRQLGVFELAAKEFEDESKSGEDEAPDVQSPSAATSSETAPPLDAAARPASPQTNPEPEPKPRPGPEPNLQEQQAEPQASIPGTVCPDPPSIKPTVFEPAASKAHLFIFDSESQQDESQSAADAPSSVDAAAPSLTQAHLDEDMERIRELMNQTDMDLVSVTKALLKTSGDFAAALNLLLNPLSVPGPFWISTDDTILLSTDSTDQQYLQEKYGKEEVAKRIVFLEVGG